MLKKVKTKLFNIGCNKPISIDRADTDNKNNMHRFSVNLDKSQSFIFKKTHTTLYEEWYNLPPQKQKFYYKLYYKLLKSEIYQKEIAKKKSSSLWVCSPSVEPFWAKVKYNKCIVKKHNGCTIKGENVYDFKNSVYLSKKLHNYKSQYSIYYKNIHELLKYE